MKNLFLLSLPLMAIPFLLDAAPRMKFSHSYVTLQETTEPGAAAEILFENSAQDGGLAGTLELTLGDIVCSVYIDVGFPQPDTIQPECPGYTVEPPILTIEDDTDGKVFLYKSWMGM